jgi:hypothetical protein
MNSNCETYGFLVQLANIQLLVKNRALQLCYAALRKENISGEYDNIMLRGIFGSKREVTE